MTEKKKEEKRTSIFHQDICYKLTERNGKSMQKEEKLMKDAFKDLHKQIFINVLTTRGQHGCCSQGESCQFKGPAIIAWVIVC